MTTQSATVERAIWGFYNVCRTVHQELRGLREERLAEMSATLDGVLSEQLPTRLPRTLPWQDVVQWEVCEHRLMNAASGAAEAVGRIRAWLEVQDYAAWADSVEDWCNRVEEHADVVGSCEFVTMDELSDGQAVALEFMKAASRDTFRLCAETAEEMARVVERGELVDHAPTALRLLAHMFTKSSQEG